MHHFAANRLEIPTEAVGAVEIRIQQIFINFMTVASVEDNKLYFPKILTEYRRIICNDPKVNLIPNLRRD